MTYTELILKLKQEKNPLCLIMCGLPFSGKTTVSKKIEQDLNCIRISFDELWVLLEKDVQDLNWDHVRDVCKFKIIKELESGNSVVYDDVNATLQMRMEIANLTKLKHFNTWVVFVDITVEEMNKRIAENKIMNYRNDVNVIEINKVTKTFEQPCLPENFIKINL